jgi:hypothetical protein
MNEAQAERPIIRMVPEAPREGGGHNLTIAFDVDLAREHDEYIRQIHQHQFDEQRPFMDEVAFIAQQIMEGFLTQSFIDSDGFGLALRKGRVIVNDVRAVTLAERYTPQDEPF